MRRAELEMFELCHGLVALRQYATKRMQMRDKSARMKMRLEDKIRCFKGGLEAFSERRRDERTHARPFRAPASFLVSHTFFVT